MSNYDEIKSRLNKSEKAESVQTRKSVSQYTGRIPRTYIDATGDQYELAKSAGAKYDFRNKCLYVHGSQLPPEFIRWAAKPVPTPIDQLVATLKSEGLQMDGSPIIDDKWHRVSVGAKDKKRSGSYKMHQQPDGSIVGSIINHKNGDGSVTFKSQPPSRAAVLNGLAPSQVIVSEADRSEYAQRRDQAKQEQKAKIDKAAKVAFGIWRNAGPWANQTNCAYLKDKKQRGYGIRVSNEGDAIIPMRDIDGRIQSLQFIKEDGTKLYLEGGAKKGHFHVIDPKRELATAEHIQFAEGYSTAASGFEATGNPTVVCFDKENLKDVVKVIHAKYPQSTKVVLGDNDHITAQKNPKLGNPGVKAAEAAAAIAKDKGMAVIPSFSDAQRKLGFTDWDDKRRSEGVSSVRREIADKVQLQSQAKEVQTVKQTSRTMTP